LPKAGLAYSRNNYWTIIGPKFRYGFARHSLSTIPLFPAGQIAATPGALSLFEQATDAIGIPLASSARRLIVMWNLFGKRLHPSPSQLFGESYETRGNATRPFPKRRPAKP